VIFGGSGDLAQRKLIPALYNLALINYERPVTINFGRIAGVKENAKIVAQARTARRIEIERIPFKN